MTSNLLPLLLSTVLLSSAPAWSADKKPADKRKSPDKAMAASKLEKTVTGKLVSLEDNGMGHTFIVETSDGKKVKADVDPGSSLPGQVEVGAQVVMTYAEVTEPRVSEARLVTGPAFKKKPSSTVRGSLVECERGDMGDYITLDQDGRHESYLADFGVISEEREASFKGKRLELSLYPYTSVQLHDIKPRP